MQRQAVEDLMVRQTLEQVQRAFSGSLVSSMVKARVMEALNAELEAENAKREPKLGHSSICGQCNSVGIRSIEFDTKTTLLNLG